MKVYESNLDSIGKVVMNDLVVGVMVFDEENELYKVSNINDINNKVSFEKVKLVKVPDEAKYSWDNYNFIINKKKYKMNEKLKVGNKLLLQDKFYNVTKVNKVGNVFEVEAELMRVNRLVEEYYIKEVDTNNRNLQGAFKRTVVATYPTYTQAIIALGIMRLNKQKANGIYYTL